MIGLTNAIEDINNKYKQIINYKMLYDFGDECIDITGGWSNDYVKTGGTFTKNADNIYIQAKGSYYEIGANTAKMIDLTPYKTAFINWNFSKSNSNYCIIRMGCGTQKNQPMYAVGTVGCLAFKNTTEQTYDGLYNMDISSINRLAYFQFMVQSMGSSYAATAIMYNFFLVKEDDWQTLAGIAGITASSIDDILTNSETLLSSKEAVSFMIKQCTGDFMVSAIQSSTFLTTLNNSEYKTKIYANEHWSKFLSMVA